MYKIVFLMSVFLLNLFAQDTTISHELSDWKEARDSSTISVSKFITRSKADKGAETFGMAKEIRNLVVGKEYTLFYSFFNGTSKFSYGRVAEDKKGGGKTFPIFENVNKDQEGRFTFKATKPTMYIVFLSTTPNAYIGVKYINLESGKQ